MNTNPFHPAARLSVSEGLQAVLIQEHNDGYKATCYESGSDALAVGGLCKAPLLREVARRFNEQAKIFDLMHEIEAAHFRTTEDTGANPTAMLVWNALRRSMGLGYISKDDLPKWDKARKGYYMPEGSGLLTASDALSNGGRV